MSKDPRERHGSAGELAAELAAADMAAPRMRTAKPSPVMIASILAVVMAAAVGVALGFFLVGRSDTTSDPTVTSTPVEVDSAVPQTPGSGGPTNSPGSTTAVAEPFDLVAAASVAKQALVRIEAFSCAGAHVSTGVVLNDGIIVTLERVLAAPWLVQVIAGGKTFSATPQPSDAAAGLAFITVDDADAFDVLDGAQVAPGAQVAIVGIDGRPALASIIVDPDDDEPAASAGGECRDWQRDRTSRHHRVSQRWARRGGPGRVRRDRRPHARSHPGQWQPRRA